MLTIFVVALLAAPPPGALVAPIEVVDSEVDTETVSTANVQVAAGVRGFTIQSSDCVDTASCLKDAKARGLSVLVRGKLNRIGSVYVVRLEAVRPADETLLAEATSIADSLGAIPGEARMNGARLAERALAALGPPPDDQDMDGVKGAADACPSVPGQPKAQGCPDADGDEISDPGDRCPGEAGTRATFGCPDADGDTVPDGTDACPKVVGDAMTGCPTAPPPDPKPTNTVGARIAAGAPTAFLASALSYVAGGAAGVALLTVLRSQMEYDRALAISAVAGGVVAGLATLTPGCASATFCDLPLESGNVSRGLYFFVVAGATGAGISAAALLSRNHQSQYVLPAAIGGGVLAAVAGPTVVALGHLASGPTTAE